MAGDACGFREATAAAWPGDGHSRFIPTPATADRRPRPRGNLPVISAQRPIEQRGRKHHVLEWRLSAPVRPAGTPFGVRNPLIGNGCIAVYPCASIPDFGRFCLALLCAPQGGGRKSAFERFAGTEAKACTSGRLSFVVSLRRRIGLVRRPCQAGFALRARLCEWLPRGHVSGLCRSVPAHVPGCCFASR